MDSFANLGVKVWSISNKDGFSISMESGLGLLLSLYSWMESTTISLASNASNNDYSNDDDDDDDDNDDDDDDNE